MDSVSWREHFPASTSTFDHDRVLVNLENPRPRLLRDSNNYIDVANSISPADPTSRTNLPGNGTIGQKDNPIARTEAKLPIAPWLTKISHQSSYNRADDFEDINTIALIAATPNPKKPTTTNHDHRPAIKGFKTLLPARPIDAVTSSSRDTAMTNHDRASSSLYPRHIVSNTKPKTLQPTLDTIDNRSHRLHCQPKRTNQAGTRSVTVSSPTTMTSSSSVMCPDCGRCRCKDCRQPRQLPSTYLCSGRRCLCSVDSCVDWVSCAWCLKAYDYHSRRNKDGKGSADGREQWRNSNKHHRWLRWTCAALACLFLPCLWCYVPLKACATAASYCYGRCHDNACRCSKKNSHVRSRSNSPLTRRRAHQQRPAVRSSSMGPLQQHSVNATPSALMRGGRYEHLERRLLIKSFSTGSDDRSRIVVAENLSKKDLKITQNQKASKLISNFPSVNNDGRRAHENLYLRDIVLRPTS